MECLVDLDQPFRRVRLDVGRWFHEAMARRRRERGVPFGDARPGSLDCREADAPFMLVAAERAQHRQRLPAQRQQGIVISPDEGCELAPDLRTRECKVTHTCLLTDIPPMRYKHAKYLCFDVGASGRLLVRFITDAI